MSLDEVECLVDAHTANMCLFRIREEQTVPVNAFMDVTVEDVTPSSAVRAM